MAWKLIGKPVTRRVTKQLAEEFDSMEPAPHDRPLSERRLAAYRVMLQNDQMRTFTWATATCAETGLTYRINGKHTSRLLSSVPTLPEFYVTIEEYRCDTIEDVARLYGTFDSRTQSRSNREIYYSFAGTIPALAEVTHTTVGLVIAGVGYHLWSDGYYNKPVGDRAELILTHADFALWVELEMQIASRKARHLMRSPVTAAMFATWSRDEFAATEFWKAVRDESGHLAILPDRKLARYLLTTAIDTGSGSKRREKAGVREVYCRCLHAWNAWRRGATTSLKYYPMADVPQAS